MNRIALPLTEGFLFLTLLLLIACGDDRSVAADSTNHEETATDLRIVVTNGRLRSAPDPEAETLRELPQGVGLTDLGRVSENMTRIRYGETTYDEPWLEVRDASGLTGWIYAREVAPANAPDELEQFRREKKLQSIFGRQLYQAIRQYEANWLQARDQSGIADLYQRGLILRDSMIPLLEQKSNVYSGDKLPDLFWIESFLPGYVSQLVAEGTVYYLFNDYSQWLSLAGNSTGTQDDRFFRLMARCYPEDSIEYFYPAWELQTWDYGGHHLLGRGVTYDILANLETTASRTPLFTEPISALKDQILADLTEPNIHFWEPDSLVKQELDSIIQANWSIFTANDRIALDARRLQLDSAAFHGIDFNARAGE